MGPTRQRFWLPLTRLGAFFVAVVVAGNVIFYSFRPTAADLPASDQFNDSYSKRRLRLRRQFNRTFQKFLGSPAAVSERAAEEPQRSMEVVQIVPPPAPIALLQAIAPPAAAPPPRTGVLAFVEPQAAPFIWPEPLAPMTRPEPVPFELPRSLGMINEAAFRAGLVSEVHRRRAADPVADFGDALLKGPELLVDGLFTCARSMSGRPALRSLDEDDGRGIAAQMLQMEIGPRKDRIWNEFLTQLGDREQRYFSGFGDARANTFAFENGTEGADLNALALDQRKVFWDALRRTYLARYKVQAEEKIKEDAWYFDRWSGADFAVLPPLLGAYVYYRGLDKKFSVAGSQVTVSIEPVSEWARRKKDISAVAAMEWSMKGWPLGVIVSTGLHDGRYGLDFVGVGTSIGTVRQVLEEETNLAQRR
jgi:hypothetical protein